MKIKMKLVALLFNTHWRILHTQTIQGWICMHISDYGQKQDGIYVTYSVGKIKGVVRQKVQAGIVSVSDTGLLTTLNMCTFV